MNGIINKVDARARTLPKTTAAPLLSFTTQSSYAVYNKFDMINARIMSTVFTKNCATLLVNVTGSKLFVSFSLMCRYDEICVQPIWNIESTIQLYKVVAVCLCSQTSCVYA